MSACIPVILIGGLFYYLATMNINEQIKSKTQSSLSLFKERVERIIQTIELESHQLATKPLILEPLAESYSKSKLYNHLKILEEFKLSTVESSFIDEIYLYDEKDNYILSDEFGYIPFENFKYKRDIEEIMESDKNVAWKHLPLSGKEGYITFFRKLPILSKSETQGILAIYVKEKPLQAYFSTNEYESSFILNEDLELILQNSEYGNGKVTLNESALNSMLENQSTSGVFYDKDSNGNKVLYTFDKSPSFGRIYVSMIPEIYISEQMNWFRWMILSSVFVFLSIGFLLTLFNARRAYNPIKQLINYSKSISSDGNNSKYENEINFIKESMKALSLEKQKLGNFKSQIEPTLREWFFQQIIEGNYVLDKFFYSKCKDYNIPVESNYVVMVVKLNVSENKLIDDEEKQITLSSLKNILSEVLYSNTMFSAVDINSIQQNIAVVIRCNQDHSYEQMKQKLNYTSAEIYNAVETYLSLNISIGVGKTCSSVNEISKSYQEGLLALQYRIYKDQEKALFFEELENTQKKGMIFYPREFEKRILESLEVRDVVYAEKSLNEFSMSVSLFESYNRIYQCFHLLLSSIIFSLEKQGNSMTDIFEHDLFGQLKSLQTIEEINHWFINHVFPLHQKLSDNTESSTGSQAVKKICQFINENISQDITLTQCAEMVNLTPSYLSRLFKKEVGVNFREYVLLRKVEEAKALCINTDARISEIAEAVGYSERNLTRLFQRYVDMTLSQYRNSHR